MRKMLGRRGAVLTGIAGATCVLLVGMSGPANAQAMFENVDIVMAGGEVQAMNSCINDASDNGVIDFAMNDCEQISMGGNGVTVEDVTVSVFEAGVFPLHRLARERHANVTFTGGGASAFNLCLNDATDDGQITIAINECNQSARAGNMTEVLGTTVTIF